MTIIKTYVKLRRKIRHCNRLIKNNKNEAKAYHDAATYHQAMKENICEKYGFNEADLAHDAETAMKFLEEEKVEN